MTDMREIGPTYYFAPPRVFENLLTQVMIRMEDAARSSARCSTTSWAWRGAAARRSSTASRACRLADRLLYALGDVAGLRPAAQRARHEPHPRRLHRRARRSARTCSASTARSASTSSSSTARPRPAPTSACSPTARSSSTPSACRRRASRSRSPTAAKCWCAAPAMLKEYYKRPDATAEVFDEQGLLPHRRRRLLRPGRPPQDHRPRQGRRAGLPSGALFAPNYIENKLKFFPYIKEAVAFGARTRRRSARSSTSTWARSATGPSGASSPTPATPTSPASPRSTSSIQECVEKVNADLAADPMLADSQIHRFLILHKELDPDDDELTRTRKVRRGFIAEKYAVLIDALYGGKDQLLHRDAGKFEDGRTGTISADVQIRDAKVLPARVRREKRSVKRRRGARMSRAGRLGARSARSLLSVENDLARLRRREGAEGRQLRRARARDPRHHRAQRRRQDLDAQRDQRRLPPAAGQHHASRARRAATWQPHARQPRASRARSRTSRCSRA